MIYDIRTDVVDPDSGEIVAEKGDKIEALDRQTLIDIIIAQVHMESGPRFHRRAYPGGERVSIESIRPGVAAKSFGFSHWTDLYLDDTPVMHFLVSEDEEHWHPMTRTPHDSGFTYDIDLETVYEGDLFEVTDAYREDLE